jgi:predicted nuclease of restriction endonuclease-like (RecB) superfamily
MTTIETETKEYFSFLNTIKQDIQTSRVRAALSVNRELILLYWRIGNAILEKQKELGWGSKVVEQLSFDLKQAFPEMKGFSKQNLFYMRQFAGAYKDYQILQQLAGQIPWFHNCTILDKIKDHKTRIWYIEKTIENGWSRNILVMQIESSAHLRLGHAKTNFDFTLPKPTSDLAQELIKSEYNFEFLGISGEVHEKVIEKGLIDNIRNFLLEMGTGFSFIGSQYRIELAGEDFVIDMLMYHIKLKCYVVIELKAGKFKPEYVGKLGFYTTAIDHEIKDDSDNPTIGLLLCQSSNQMMVEYCLKDTRKPIGVSEYSTGLPENYQKLLPTEEQFQHLLETFESEKKYDRP